MADEKVVKRFEEAQRAVEQAENGQLEWMELLNMNSGPALSGVSDVAERFGEMYARTRMTEAAAYRFRDDGEVTERRLIEHRVAEMRGQLPAIDALESQVDEMTTEQLAEIGKMYAKKECAWAKRVIGESFRTWGF